MDEKSVWKGSPSHLLNFGVYFLSFLVFALFIAIWILAGKSMKGAGSVIFFIAIAITAIPFLFILYKWLWIKSQVFEITSERVKVKSGILNKKMNVLELYRVKDYVLTEPFLFRIFSVGTIDIITSDPTNPHLLIRAIRKPQKLLDELRTYVEFCRERKGVRQLDVDQVDKLDPQ